MKRITLYAPLWTKELDIIEWMFLILFFEILRALDTYNKMKENIAPRPQNVEECKGIEKSENVINYQKICIVLL